MRIRLFLTLIVWTVRVDLANIWSQASGQKLLNGEPQRVRFIRIRPRRPSERGTSSGTMGIWHWDCECLWCVYKQSLTVYSTRTIVQYCRLYLDYSTVWVLSFLNNRRALLLHYIGVVTVANVHAHAQRHVLERGRGVGAAADWRSDIQATTSDEPDVPV